MELVGLLVLIPIAFFATRYLCKTDMRAKLPPICYVVGIILAPVTIVLAICKWLFVGRF